MIWIADEAGINWLDTSVHSTTVPFKSILTEPIDNVEIRGEAP